MSIRAKRLADEILDIQYPTLFDAIGRISMAVFYSHNSDYRIAGDFIFASFYTCKCLLRFVQEKVASGK